VLGIISALSYLILAVFLISQIVRTPLLPGDLRFTITLWLASIGGASILCVVLRPQIIHVAYAMKIGLHLRAQLPGADYPDSRLQLFARRWAWGIAGTVATCCWVLGAAVNIAAAFGVLAVRGANLDVVMLLLCHIAAVAQVMRFVGPTLAELDNVYQVARGQQNSGSSPDNVVAFPHTGS
jgi:hypothetical protein